MNYTVSISAQAVETFDAIRNQIKQRWGAKEVSNFESRLINIIDLISQSPFIFQSVEKLPNVRKAFIHKNCSMFYEINGESISVLFFWDNRQNPVL